MVPHDSATSEMDKAGRAAEVIQADKVLASGNVHLDLPYDRVARRRHRSSGFDALAM
jgi:hypothetical protein